MCRSKAEGGRRCRGLSGTAAGARFRKRISRAQKAVESALEAGDMDAYLKASTAVTHAQMAFERAQADHELLCSGQPLSAEDRYRVLMNEQRDRRRVSPAQAMALQEYVGNSDRFNHCLRNPERWAADPHTRAQVRDIQRVLKRSHAPEDLTVYRVVPADATATDRAFLSTTTDPEFARRFQKQFGGRPTRILKIDVKAGSRALFINNTFEREVLLLGEDHHPAVVWKEPLPAAAAS